MSYDRWAAEGNCVVVDDEPHASFDALLALELEPLTLGDVLRAQRRGAQVLDTRSPEAFADGHLAASTHIALRDDFSDWADALLSRRLPIVLVSAPGSERDAARALGELGFERVVGYLHGGIDAVRHLLFPVRHPIRISSASLRKRLARGPLTVIDVSTEAEWRLVSIPGSVNIPLRQLRERIGEVPDGPIVVCCRTGERSSTAASLLEQAGRMNVVDLIGGIAAWQTLTVADTRAFS